MPPVRTAPLLSRPSAGPGAVTRRVQMLAAWLHARQDIFLSAKPFPTPEKQLQRRGTTQRQARQLWSGAASAASLLLSLLFVITLEAWAIVRPCARSPVASVDRRPPVEPCQRLFAGGDDMDSPGQET